MYLFLLKIKFQLDLKVGKPLSLIKKKTIFFLFNFQAYASKGNLARHVKYECGKIASQKCAVCDYKTKHKFSLKRHILACHPDDYVQIEQLVLQRFYYIRNLNQYNKKIVQSVLVIFSESALMMYGIYYKFSFQGVTNAKPVSSRINTRRRWPVTNGTSAERPPDSSANTWDANTSAN